MNKRIFNTAALACGALMLAACEQPLRPANPAPLQAVADHFGVPVAVLYDLQRTTDQLARTAPPEMSGPPVSGPEVERLQRTLRLLEQTYTPVHRAAP